MIETYVSASIINREQEFHYHDGLEIYFVLQGSAIIINSSREVILNKDDIIVINYADLHKIIKCSDDFLCVQFLLKTDSFDRYIPGISDIVCKCDPEINHYMAYELKQEIKSGISEAVVLMYFDKESQNRETSIIYLCIEILNNLKLGFQYGKNDLVKPSEEYVWERIWKIAAYLYSNYFNKITLKSLAEHVGLNEVYLSRFLKKHYGKSFEKILSFVRSEVSIRYLLSTDMSITAISYECGFSAPRYYNAAFKENYGCTPQEWRDKNTKIDLKIMESDGKRMTIDAGIDAEYVNSVLKRYYVTESDRADAKSYVIDIRKEILRQEKTYYKAVKSSEKLFYPNGQRKPSGYIADFIAKAGRQYSILDEHVTVFRKKTAVGVIINNKTDNQLDMVVTFEGLDKEKIYLCQTLTTKVLPKKLEIILQDGGVADEWEKVISPDETYELLEDCNATLKELHLRSGQANLILIDELHIEKQ